MARNNKSTNGFTHEPERPGEAAQVYYFDSAGISWRAYERRRPGQRPALVFESANAIRLVRDYPANWYTLPRAALEALSWSV
jgi:hypothetical protein